MSTPQSPAPKDQRIEVRVTAAQRRRFEEAARREGLSLSAWIRRLCTLAARRKP